MTTQLLDRSTVNLILAGTDLRVPLIEGLPGVPTATCTWTPDLTAAEQATLADIVAMAKAGVVLSLAEYQALKPDLAGLRTYAGIASPTLVQTASAVKAQSRILRALLRDA